MGKKKGNHAKAATSRALDRDRQAATEPRAAGAISPQSGAGGEARDLDESIRTVLVGIQAVQDGAHAMFTESLGRLEEDAAARVEELLATASARAVASAAELDARLEEMWALVGAAGEDAIAEYSAMVARAERGVVEHEDSVRRAAHESTERMVASQVAAEAQAERLAELDTWVAASTEEVVAAHSALTARAESTAEEAVRAIDGAASEATERMRASQRVVDDQSGRLRSVVSEAVSHIGAVRDARGEVEAAADRLESWAAERLADADRRNEERVRELDTAMATARAGLEHAAIRATEEIAATRRAVEESASHAHDEAARAAEAHLATVVTQAEADAQERRGRQERLLDEQSERLQAVVKEAEAHAGAVRDARGEVEAAAEVLELWGAERLAEAARRNEERVGELDALAADSRDALERLVAESAERMAASQREVAAQADQLREDAETGLAAVLTELQSDVEARRAEHHRMVAESSERLREETERGIAELLDDAHRAVDDARASARTRADEQLDRFVGETVTLFERAEADVETRRAAEELLSEEQSARLRAAAADAESVADAVRGTRSEVESAAVGATEAFDRLVAEASERLAAAQREVTEQADRLREHSESRLAALVAQMQSDLGARSAEHERALEEQSGRARAAAAEVESQACAAREARVEVEAAAEVLQTWGAERLAQADARHEERVRALDALAAETRSALERAAGESVDAIAGSRRAVEEHASRVREEATRTVTELRASADRELADLHEGVRSRADEYAGRMEEHLAARFALAEADFEARRAEHDVLAEGAAQRMAASELVVHEQVAQIRAVAGDAETLVERLRADIARDAAELAAKLDRDLAEVQASVRARADDELELLRRQRVEAESLTVAVHECVARAHAVLEQVDGSAEVERDGHDTLDEEVSSEEIFDGAVLDGEGPDGAAFDSAGFDGAGFDGEAFGTEVSVGDGFGGDSAHQSAAGAVAFGALAPASAAPWATAEAEETVAAEQAEEAEEAEPSPDDADPWEMPRTEPDRLAPADPFVVGAWHDGESISWKAGDDHYFSRLASELRDDPDGGELPGPYEPSPAAEPFSPLPITTATRSGSVATAAAVNATASMTGLREAVALLGAGEPNRAVRVQVVRAGVPAAPTSLRLTTHDDTGWWEFTDVPVNADASESRSVVVDLDELDSALDSVSRFAGATSAQLLVDGNVTIGTHLLLARDAVAVPALARDVAPVEPLDLQKSDRSGLVVESQVGRLYASPEVLGQLKRRHARQVELALIGDIPFVTAQVTGSQGGVSTIATPLQALGDGEVPTLPERRTTNGNEVSQLVNALATTTSQEELARLLKVGVGYVRRKAAAHPALEKQVITSLVKEGTEAMRAAAATNPSIGVAARDIAMSDPSALVRASLAGNPAITEAELQLLAEDPVASVRAGAAANPKATPELVTTLADDPDDLVRATVASHPGVDVELLRELAHDSSPAVCKAVAKNPSCPTDVLLELVSTVPDAVLANPNASEALLTAGSVVDDPSLRAAVAKNPATGPKLLRKLARDRDADVLRGVASHPQTPLVTRRRLQRQLSTDAPVEPGS